MLGVEAVAERMADHVVGHHPTMPGIGKTAQAVVATRCLEDRSHASMMTIVPCLCKTMAPASSTGLLSVTANREAIYPDVKRAIVEISPQSTPLTSVPKVNDDTWMSGLGGSVQDSEAEPDRPPASSTANGVQYDEHHGKPWAALLQLFFS